MPFKNYSEKLAYARKLYQKNRKKIIEQVKKHKQEVKKWVNEYKKTLKCVVCGESHPATLDFHHKNRKEKEKGICFFMMNGYAIKTIKKEIEKCEILCANCHRKLHYENSNL